MLEVIATGVASSICCQPEAVSLLNVIEPSSVPALLQRLPTCVPVLAAALQKRIPAIFPATSDWNFTPNSTALSGPLSAVPGTTVLGQRLTLVGAEETVMLKALLATCCGLPASLTRAVKVKVPALVGVPVMAPVAVLSAKPPGSDPLAIDQA